MKLMRWTIWVLGVLLITATLDSQPDPPALNPSNALSTVLSQHDCVCSAPIQRRDSLATSVPCPISLVTADSCEPYRPSDRMILTVQAADPSPPAIQAGRT